MIAFLIFLSSCTTQNGINSNNTINKVNVEKDSEENINIESYFKPETAKTFITNKYVSANLWYDDNKWYYKTSDKLPLEYIILLKNGDVSVFFSSTGIEIPIDSIHDLLIKNTYEKGKEVEIINDNVRKVNNASVMYLRYKAIINSVPLLVSEYYWSGKKGLVELSAITSQGLYESKKDDIEELLNGLWIME